MAMLNNQRVHVYAPNRKSLWNRWDPWLVGVTMKKVRHNLHIGTRGMGSSGKASLMKTHLSAPASCSFLSRRLSMKSSKSSGSLVIVEGCRQSCLMMSAFPPACSMFHQKSIDFNVAILSCHVQRCCTCSGVLFNEESIDFNVAICSCYPERCCTVMGALVLICSLFNQESNDFNVPMCSCHAQWCSNIIGALVLVCPVFSQESNNFSMTMCCCHPERCCTETSALVFV